MHTIAFAESRKDRQIGNLSTFKEKAHLCLYHFLEMLSMFLYVSVFFGAYFTTRPHGDNSNIFETTQPLHSFGTDDVMIKVCRFCQPSLVT